MRGMGWWNRGEGPEKNEQVLREGPEKSEQTLRGVQKKMNRILRRNCLNVKKYPKNFSPSLRSLELLEVHSQSVVKYHLIWNISTYSQYFFWKDTTQPRKYIISTKKIISFIIQVKNDVSRKRSILYIL